MNVLTQLALLVGALLAAAGFVGLFFWGLFVAEPLINDGQVPGGGDMLWLLAEAACIAAGYWLTNWARRRKEAAR